MMKSQWPGDLCSLLFQLVKKLSNLTGCTQVVDVGSGQVSQTPDILSFQAIRIKELEVRFKASGPGRQVLRSSRNRQQSVVSGCSRGSKRMGKERKKTN